MSDAALCGTVGCFNEAAFEVIPKGRWRNLPITKACRKCVKDVVLVYKTKTTAGEPGWADTMPIVSPKRAPRQSTSSKPNRKRIKKAPAESKTDPKAEPIKEAMG